LFASGHVFCSARAEPTMRTWERKGQDGKPWGGHGMAPRWRPMPSCEGAPVSRAGSLPGQHKPPTLSGRAVVAVLQGPPAGSRFPALVRCSHIYKKAHHTSHPSFLTHTLAFDQPQIHNLTFSHLHSFNKRKSKPSILISPSSPSYF
jgi:hypothetical protein